MHRREVPTPDVVPGPRATPVVLLFAAVACAVAPFLRWVAESGFECGWTCYVPLSERPRTLDLLDANGWTAAVVLQIVLVVLAFAAAAAALTRVGRRPVTGRAWAALALLGAVAAVAVAVSMLAWSPAGVDGLALRGPGAVVAVVAAGTVAVLSGAQVLAARRTASV